MTNLSKVIFTQLSRVPGQLARLPALQLLNLAANRLGAVLCSVSRELYRVAAVQSAYLANPSCPVLGYSAKITPTSSR